MSLLRHIAILSICIVLPVSLGVMAKSHPSIARSPTFARFDTPGGAWPKFHHDVSNSGLGIGQGANDQERWAFQTAGSIYSSPAIGAGGNVYFGSNDKNVYSVNSSGSKNWSYATGGAVESGPALDVNGNVYVGSDDGCLYALSSSGSKIWDYQTNGKITSSPCLYTGALMVGGTQSVFVGSNDGNLYAVNSQNGSLVWEYSTGAAITSSPVFDSQGNVLACSQNGKVYSFSPSGTLNWTVSTNGAIESSPAIGFVSGTETLFVGCDDGNLYEIQLGSSPTVSKIALSARPGTSSPALGTFSGALQVSIGDAAGNLYLINPATGSITWQMQIGEGVQVTSPVFDSTGVIYAGTADGFYSVNQSSPTLVWTAAASTSNTVIGATSISPAIGSDGAIYFGGRNASAPIGTGDFLFVIGNGIQLSGVSLNPSTVTGGAGSTGTVTLSGPAPSGGVTVNLSASGTSATLSGSSVTISAGQTSATFTVSTTPVSSPATSTVTASLTGTTQTATLTINPPAVASVSLSPTSVLGGNSSTGTVSINEPAPTGGSTVALSSSASSVASVPSSVTVSAGATSATFAITTTAVSANTNVTITATLNGSQTATLTVNEAGVSSLTISPSSVLGGTSSTGTVSLNGPAGPGGDSINLSSSATSVANVPSSVTVTAGSTSTTFTISTSPVSSNAPATITATLGTSATATIAVTVPTVTLTLSGTIHSGDTATGTVTLSGPAGPSGCQVSLTVPTNASYVTLEDSSGNPLSSPASITVPAGATSATFDIYGNPTDTTAQGGVTITATGANSSSASMGVLGSSLHNFSPNQWSGLFGGAQTVTVTVDLAGTLGTVGTGGLSVSFTTNNDSVINEINGQSMASGPVVVLPSLTANSTTSGVHNTTGPYTFTITTNPVAANTSVTITGTQTNGSFATTTSSFTLNILPPRPSSVVLSSNSVTGGQNSPPITGTVYLSGPAPAGGSTVTMYSSTEYALFTETGTPTQTETVLIPANATTYSFTLNTTAPTTQVANTVKAAISTVYQASTILTINPSMYADFVSEAPPQNPNWLDMIGRPESAPDPSTAWFANLAPGVFVGRKRFSSFIGAVPTFE